LHASKIKPLFACLVLFKMQNIAVMPKNEISDRGIETFLIRTLDE
jgi:hypothetical protein